jgi:hypothetical protein
MQQQFQRNKALDCRVASSTTAASPPANRVMLHIEAAAIAEKQNFDCRVNSNYEREREREREREM